MNGGTWWENVVIYRSREYISKEVMVDQLTGEVKGDVWDRFPACVTVTSAC